MTRQSAVVVAIYLVTSLGLTGLSRVLDERLKTETGLIQSVELGIDDERTPLFTRTTSDIDLAFLDDPELGVLVADSPECDGEIDWPRSPCLNSRHRRSPMTA